MIHVFIAASRTEERRALQMLLADLQLDLAGEAADWVTTLAEAPTSNADMLLIDAQLLPDSPFISLTALREACQSAISVVLFSQLDPNEQAAVSSGADLFISMGENAERAADRFRALTTARQAPEQPVLPVT